MIYNKIERWDVISPFCYFYNKIFLEWKEMK